MPIVPVRGVGEIGVISDINPQDLPFTAWSDAKNMRFDGRTLKRFSVFKKYEEGNNYTKTPVSVFNGGGSTSDSHLVTLFSDGSMEQRYNGTVTDVTPTGSLNTAEYGATVSFIGDLTYVNRESDIPVYRRSPFEGSFVQMASWPTGERCKSLRAYKDFLIAMNVSKSSGSYPGMVKWSDVIQTGAPPSNWNVTSASSLSGETVLNDIQGGLVDGGTMGDSFILYGDRQTFRMNYIGTPFIFVFEKLFEDQGVININCFTDVDSKHYVFGRSDIFIHDGASKVSIATDKVLRKVYSELDFDRTARCFTFHDLSHGEVWFCYPSISSDVQWDVGVTAGCNKAAVFNYRAGTWTFVDLPSLVGATEISQMLVPEWGLDGDWGTATATWNSFDGRRPKTLLVASSGNPTLGKQGCPYFVDDMIGGRIGNVFDSDVLWPAYAEALYKDLDELKAELYGRKVISRIIPQIKTYDDESQVGITFGQSKTVSGSITWGRYKLLSPWTDDKYDTRINGRYLSLRVDIPPGSYAEFSGYDADVRLISRR